LDKLRDRRIVVGDENPALLLGIVGWTSFTQ
jgi:hypothetical protein